MSDELWPQVPQRTGLFVSTEVDACKAVRSGTVGTMTGALQSNEVTELTEASISPPRQQPAGCQGNSQGTPPRHRPPWTVLSVTAAATAADHRIHHRPSHSTRRSRDSEPQSLVEPDISLGRCLQGNVRATGSRHDPETCTNQRAAETYAPVVRMHPNSLQRPVIGTLPMARPHQETTVQLRRRPVPRQVQHLHSVRS